MTLGNPNGPVNLDLNCHGLVLTECVFNLDLLRFIECVVCVGLTPHGVFASVFQQITELVSLHLRIKQIRMGVKQHLGFFIAGSYNLPFYYFGVNVAPKIDA